MTAPNRNTLWARVLVDELAAAGVRTAVLAPGSRSTPLTVAFAEHADVTALSLLDERSAAFFALGRSKRTGEPTAVVTTSGTATANLHPAVLEADAARVPLLVLTADRPPELQDSGANQTTDQTRLYGDAVRAYRTLPEPAPRARALRSLRVTAVRAVATTTGTPPGPVHLNVPFRKPLEPTPVEGDVPADLAERAPLAVAGRDGPFVRVEHGRPELSDASLDAVARALEDATRGLVVAGPSNQPTPRRDALAMLARASDIPILADPLSGHRFGHDEDIPVCGGYDAYIDAARDWPDPDVVIRFGASPTSKAARQYLRDADARQFVVDPGGGWSEAEFTASDLLVADPTRLARRLADRVASAGERAWRDRFARAESEHWSIVNDATDDGFEGAILSAVATNIQPGSTLVVSNSMPVRDLDRFGRPRAGAVRVLGNRGVSGIDGMTSTALGAGSDGPVTLVIGDLAFYHDMNGLLALKRCDVAATIVLLNNDGGGIFHKLPIESFDPPFTEYFRTPHGLDFSPVGDLYGAEFVTTTSVESFRSLYTESIDSDGTQIIEVRTDGEASERQRERLKQRLTERLSPVE
ncbi:MAG: 2-succinyl-5-enolpyruvyl-6-hydroxy-3-cyclohexene-1-carboxylic-acid synthase [Halorhabdus sp.]